MFDRDTLIEELDATHASMSLAQRHLLSLIAEVDRHDAWRDAGARDTAHWLSMRYGISSWKAHRWIAAAHALRGLPRLADALARGELGIDKVVELARFAAAGTEADLIRWARDVSCAAVATARHVYPTNRRQRSRERAPWRGGGSTRDADSVSR